MCPGSSPDCLIYAQNLVLTVLYVPRRTCGGPRGEGQARGSHEAPRHQSKREQLETFEGPLPESQGQNLVLTVLYVPCLLGVPEVEGVRV